MIGDNAALKTAKSATKGVRETATGYDYVTFRRKVHREKPTL
jgi:hypothetical protein